MADTHRIGNGLSATVKAEGAELCSLLDADGRELMWDGASAWPNHSPVLFPIVGTLAHDRLLVDGHSFPMARHGFARRRRFEWIERSQVSCSLVLRDDAETRAVFPFAFSLNLSYRVEAGALRTEYILHNPGDRALPASLGAHPAFRWPLRRGTASDHRITFAEDEPGPIHRLQDNLLDSAARPSPLQGRVLDLHPGLFADDAIIMLEPRSRQLRYEGPEGGIEFGWEGFPHLGLWQKPGAELLCIEPWHGYASRPAGTANSRTSPV